MLITITIVVTFLLLVIGEVVAIIWATRFAAQYERRHKELELRVEVLERRLPGETPK